MPFRGGGGGFHPGAAAGGDGAVTALNNATENELVTIGSTTTELDAEANLTFDGSLLTVAADVNITGSGHLIVSASNKHGAFYHNGTDAYLTASSGNVVVLPGNDANLWVGTATPDNSHGIGIRAAQNAILLFRQNNSTTAQLYASYLKDQFVLSVGSNVGRQLVLGNQDLGGSPDYGHAVTDHPTFFIHSNVDPTAGHGNQWLSLHNDGTSSFITNGALTYATYSLGSTVTVTGSRNFVVDVGASNTSGYGITIQGRENGSLLLHNGSSTPNEYLPLIKGRASDGLGAATIAGLYLSGAPADNDADNPSVVVRGLNAAENADCLGDPFEVRNYNTKTMTVGPGGLLTSYTNFCRHNDHAGKSPGGFFTGTLPTNGDIAGRILQFSSGSEADSLDAGQLYFLYADGTWNKTNAVHQGLGDKHLLGIGNGAASTAGVLLDGYARIPTASLTSKVPTFVQGGYHGKPLYMSDVTSGSFTFTAPTASKSIVRVVGYAIDGLKSGVAGITDILIYFNPDKTSVELS